MIQDYNLDNCLMKELQPIATTTGKGWGYSSVYNLRELKDTYLVFKYSKTLSIKQLLESCHSMHLKSESGKYWTERNLLELVNAWVNFGYLEKKKNGYGIKREACFDSDINEALSKGDKVIFRNIYFSYFKFYEFHRLFNHPEKNDQLSGFIYTFMHNMRFTNCFLHPSDRTLYYIDDSHQDMMRFWDVYSKWGTELDVIGKLSLQAFNIIPIDERLRNANMIYVVRKMPTDFSVIDYINKYLPYNYIPIMEIEWKLVNDYFFKIDDIKNKIIEECSSTKSKFRIQSTSSNFIKRNNHRYYPMVNSTYVSHLLRV